MLTFGMVVSCVTMLEEEAVHPPGSVAVTVYVPADVTNFVAPVVPPDHAKVTPAVEEDAVSISLSRIHVRGVGLLMFMLGGFADCTTVVDADDVQLFKLLVAVTE